MKWDLHTMSRVLTAEAEITLPDTTMEELSALDATTKKSLQELLLSSLRQPLTVMEARNVLRQCLTMLDMNTAKSASNGSPAFMWTYQQLSGGDWSGASLGNSSSSNSEMSGKPVTSTVTEGNGMANATPKETSTNAYTYMGELWWGCVPKNTPIV